MPALRSGYLSLIPVHGLIMSLGHTYVLQISSPAALCRRATSLGNDGTYEPLLSVPYVGRAASSLSLPERDHIMASWHLHVAWRPTRRLFRVLTRHWKADTSFSLVC